MHRSSLAIQQPTHDIHVRVLGAAGITVERLLCRDISAKASSPAPPEDMKAVVILSRGGSTCGVSNLSTNLKRSPSKEPISARVGGKQRFLALWNQTSEEPSLSFSTSLARYRREFEIQLVLTDGSTTIPIGKAVLQVKHGFDHETMDLPLYHFTDDARAAHEIPGLGGKLEGRSAANSSGTGSSPYKVDSHDAALRVEVTVTNAMKDTTELWLNKRKNSYKSESNASIIDDGSCRTPLGVVHGQSSMSSNSNAVDCGVMCLGHSRSADDSEFVVEEVKRPTYVLDRLREEVNARNVRSIQMRNTIQVTHHSTSKQLPKWLSGDSELSTPTTMEDSASRSPTTSIQGAEARQAAVAQNRHVKNKSVFKDRLKKIKKLEKNDMEVIGGDAPQPMDSRNSHNKPPTPLDSRHLKQPQHPLSPPSTLKANPRKAHATSSTATTKSNDAISGSYVTVSSNTGTLKASSAMVDGQIVIIEKNNNNEIQFARDTAMTSTSTIRTDPSTSGAAVSHLQRGSQKLDDGPKFLDSESMALGAAILQAGQSAATTITKTSNTASEEPMKTPSRLLNLPEPRHDHDEDDSTLDDDTSYTSLPTVRSMKTRWGVADKLIDLLPWHALDNAMERLHMHNFAMIPFMSRNSKNTDKLEDESLYRNFSKEESFVSATTDWSRNLSLPENHGWSFEDEETFLERHTRCFPSAPCWGLTIDDDVVQPRKCNFEDESLRTKSVTSRIEDDEDFKPKHETLEVFLEDENTSKVGIHFVSALDTIGEEAEVEFFPEPQTKVSTSNTNNKHSPNRRAPHGPAFGVRKLHDTERQRTRSTFLDEQIELVDTRATKLLEHENPVRRQQNILGEDVEIIDDGGFVKSENIVGSNRHEHGCSMDSPARSVNSLLDQDQQMLAFSKASPGVPSPQVSTADESPVGVEDYPALGSDGVLSGRISDFFLQDGKDEKKDVEVSDSMDLEGNGGVFVVVDSTEVGSVGDSTMTTHEMPVEIEKYKQRKSSQKIQTRPLMNVLSCSSPEVLSRTRSVALDLECTYPELNLFSFGDNPGSPKASKSDTLFRRQQSMGFHGIAESDPDMQAAAEAAWVKRKAEFGVLRKTSRLEI